MKLKQAIFAALFALALAAPALARDVPLASGERFSLGLQAGAGWLKDADAEAMVAANPAFNVGSVGSLVAPARYGFGTEQFDVQPSFSVMLKDGNVQAFVRAGYGWFWRDGDVQDEPVVAGSIVLPLKSRFAVSLPAHYRTESEAWGFDVRLSWLAFPGGE